jgi:hypothetical protein
MPLPYVWLFAFLIPFSCSMTLLAQPQPVAGTKPARPSDDPDMMV